jgi:hypothetical protein
VGLVDNAGRAINHILQAAKQAMLMGKVLSQEVMMEILGIYL